MPNGVNNPDLIEPAADAITPRLHPDVSEIGVVTTHPSDELGKVVSELNDITTGVVSTGHDILPPTYSEERVSLPTNSASESTQEIPTEAISQTSHGTPEALIFEKRKNELQKQKERRELKHAA